MPELATAYFTGLVFCLALTVLFTFLRMQRRKTPEFICLQKNLQTIQMYWSENLDSVIPLHTGLDTADVASLNRSSALLGAVLSLLSWAGVFFLLIVMLSYRYLARSRRERRAFSSPLAKHPNLPSPEVAQLVERLDLRNLRLKIPRASQDPLVHGGAHGEPV